MVVGLKFVTPMPGTDAAANTNCVQQKGAPIGSFLCAFILLCFEAAMFQPGFKGGLGSVQTQG